MIAYEEDGITLYEGDVLAVLAALPEESVDCVVTSPPYWSLRKYSGEGVVWGGDPACAHEWADVSKGGAAVEGYAGKKKWQHSVNGRDEAHPEARHRVDNPDDWTRITITTDLCRCGAWRGQYGLEPTPDLYVEHTLTVLRAIRRVLKPSGVVWWNIGDGYSGSWGNYSGQNRGAGHQRAIVNGSSAPNPAYDGLEGWRPASAAVSGLKPKDLIAMPWRVGLAAQADGWWLRCDVVWAKPNPMPESVRDRPTRAHEYVLMLTKSERYYFDQNAVREPAGGRRSGNVTRKTEGDGRLNNHRGFGFPYEPDGSGRNIRSVWSFPAQPSALPHFAAFPEELAERCIKAACPAGGIVLDPFAGTGTALKVARDLGRQSIGIEISAEYCELARKRLSYGVRGVMAIERGQEELPEVKLL